MADSALSSSLFDEPSTLEEANRRIAVLRDEIARIHHQLEHPPEHLASDPGWRRKAHAARMFKTREKNFLGQWIHLNQGGADIPLSEAEKKVLFTEKSVGASMRFASKCWGDFLNLLAAVEVFLETDTDEAFDQMANAAEKIRGRFVPAED